MFAARHTGTAIAARPVQPLVRPRAIAARAIMTFMAEPSKLLEEALALPPGERAKLAASLIDSLDPEREDDVEEAWRVEVSRRVRQLDDGSVEAIDWAEARRQILS